MTTIRTINNQSHAALLLSYLHDKEILAVLTDQHSNAYEFVPIRLQVPDHQAEEAQRWLAEFDAAPPLPPEEQMES